MRVVGLLFLFHIISLLTLLWRSLHVAIQGISVVVYSIDGSRLKKRISFCERNCFNYSCNKNSKASAFSTPCPISILSDPHVIRWLHLTMKPNLMTFKTTSTWWQKKRDDIGLVAWWKMHHQRVMMTGCPKESREKAFFFPHLLGRDIGLQN